MTKRRSGSWRAAATPSAQPSTTSTRASEAVEQRGPPPDRRPARGPRRPSAGRNVGLGRRQDQHRAGRRRRRASAASARWPASASVTSDGGEGVAGGRLEGGLPALVDLDLVEQRAEDAVDLGEALGPGPVAGLVERERQRLGPGRPRVLVGVGAAADLLGRGDAALAAAAARPRRPRLGARPARCSAASALGDLGPQALGLGGQPRRPSPRARSRRAADALDLGGAALDAGLQRGQLAAHLGGPARRRAVGSGSPHVGVEAGPLVLDVGLDRGDALELGRDLLGLGVDLGQLAGQLGRLGLEAGDERPGRPARRARARCPGRARPAATARPRACSRSDSERTRSSPRSSPPRADRRDSAPSTSVSSVGEPGPQRAVLLAEVAPGARRGCRGAACSRVSSRPATWTRRVVSSSTSEPCRRAASAWRSSGRSWRRTSRSRSWRRVRLPSVDGEPALGLLLAAPVLQDAGRLLDDQPPVLGPGVEHRVDLALGDDHVLLAADAGVGQELLDVEQPARARR